MTNDSHSEPARPLAERIDTYVTEIVRACRASGVPLASIVVFGSGAAGSYEAGVSDLDLLLVLSESAGPIDRRRVSLMVAELEARHGFAKPVAQPAARLLRMIQATANRFTGHGRTFFVCTRGDLLSGEPGRILGLPKLQSVFVDRIVIPGIVRSARTVWGEDLLCQIPLLPVRRFDVAKAFLGLFSQAALALAIRPIIPDAMHHSMDALKRSVHSCYFCFNGRSAPIATEIAYFEQRYGRDPGLRQLLALRRDHRSSVGFMTRCFLTITRLHLRTARDARFPLGPLESRGMRPNGGVAADE